MSKNISQIIARTGIDEGQKSRVVTSLKGINISIGNRMNASAIKDYTVRSCCLFRFWRCRDFVADVDSILIEKGRQKTSKLLTNSLLTHKSK